MYIEGFHTAVMNTAVRYTASNMDWNHLHYRHVFSSFESWGLRDPVSSIEDFAAKLNVLMVTAFKNTTVIYTAVNPTVIPHSVVTYTVIIFTLILMIEVYYILFWIIQKCGHIHCSHCSLVNCGIKLCSHIHYRHF